MKEKQPSPITVAQVQDRLDAIAANRSELMTRRGTLEQRIGSTQQQSARKYLDGDRSGFEEAARLRSEIDTIGGALDLLASDAKAAELNLRAAKAREFREQAAQKRADLEQLNQKTGKILAALSEAEGVVYSSSILSSQPLQGSWLQWGTVKPPEPWQVSRNCS